MSRQRGVTVLGLTREESARAVQLLLDQGFTRIEAAGLLGVKVGTVHAWLLDPDGSKQKKTRLGYRGSCVDCGKPTDGSSGPGRASARCSACSHAYEEKSAVWTRDTLIDAVHEWVRLFGEVPTTTEWNPSPSVLRRLTPERRAQVAERRAAGRWPRLDAVNRVFGSLPGLIAAAGYEPRKPGEKRPRLPKQTTSVASTDNDLHKTGICRGTIHSFAPAVKRTEGTEEPKRPFWLNHAEETVEPKQSLRSPQ